MRSRLSTYLLACQRRGVDTAILAVSLMASAYLMAFATGPAGPRWVGWYALLPLFVAIRVYRPAAALLAGALWGGSLYFFAASGLGSIVSPGLGSLLLLVALPAIYAYLGARLTRWIGFSPFVLGVGWIGVELGLAPLGLGEGLLGTTQSETTLLHWIASALGYVHVALLAALFNAYLVMLLSRVRVQVSSPRRVFGVRHIRRLLLPQDVSHPSLLFIEAIRPRGPPARGICAATWIVCGSVFLSI